MSRSRREAWPAKDDCLGTEKDADALKVLDSEGPNREARPSIQAIRMHHQTPGSNI